ncbi:MAG TPA: hypothetical protein VFD01_07425, partial [Candidatus Dormibacteraeota bacterium]|nr:hypothetical protein [Candidatus Dormibacteraeota bacterium]
VESMLVGAALVVMAFLGPIALLNLLPTLEGALGQWHLHGQSATATIPQARPRTVGRTLARAARPASAPFELPARVAARTGRARPEAAGSPAPTPRPPRPRPPDGRPPEDGARRPDAVGRAGTARVPEPWLEADPPRPAAAPPIPHPEVEEAAR